MTLLWRTIIVDAVNATTTTSTTNAVTAGTALPSMMETKNVVAKEQRGRKVLLEQAIGQQFWYSPSTLKNHLMY
jgi:hypothetical protein